ncbi:MAG: signal recognition particle-docking protein FtsY [Anaerolineales bacterium]
MSFIRGLAKTRQAFTGRIMQVMGNTEIDDESYEDLEALMLQADIGFATTTRIIERLQAREKREGLTRTTQLYEALKDELTACLTVPTPLNISGRPLSVVLIIGVNGSGKTTSIGKLARRMRLNNRHVIIAAGDTFRAAAVDQLKIWGERAGVHVVAGRENSDPGAVVYDAVEAARAREAEVLIVDTAGRLHSNYNLMKELEKIRNVIAKQIPDAPHETLLVLDGTTGQNALVQAKKFTEAANVTGLIITKLDSSAKGGMLFAIQDELGLPIHYVGLGEKIEDLIFFEPERFVDSMFADEEAAE